MNHQSWLRFMADTADEIYTLVVVKSSIRDVHAIRIWRKSVVDWVYAHVPTEELYDLEADDTNHDRLKRIREAVVLLPRFDVVMLWVREPNLYVDPLVFKTTFHK